MADGPPGFTQFDISANSITASSAGSQGAASDAMETNRLLRDMIALQTRSCELLGELVNQVSLQQRQRLAELKAWKEANPELARSCRQAAESLAKVHTEFLSGIARDAAENAEDFTDSEYALGEFIDRYGPRLAHFNGVLQLFAQLGAPLPTSDSATGN
ncbi:MAG: hypothetical protein WCH77_04200 [Planctomycetota bacterium]